MSGTNVYAVALTGMQQDMSRVDRVALNLANVATPGYKREVVAVRPFAAVVEAQAGAGTPSVPGVPGAVQVLTDARAGTLRMTSQPLDLALEGEGYFEVVTEAGPAYTRQGSFRLDARGRLVTMQGLPVMGVDGELQLATGSPTIDPTGRITDPAGAGAPGAAVARLKIVSFEAPSALARLGDGLLAPPPGMAGRDAPSTTVRQGALENSNVDSTQEMLQLIQAMRHFESMQKVVQGYDELQSVAIRRLGDLA
jgi:flagellar basal-body rod protein FlgG